MNHESANRPALTRLRTDTQCAQLFQTVVHTVLRQRLVVVGGLELRLVDEDPLASVEFGACWAEWRTVAHGVDEFLRRYCVDTSPSALVELPPLCDLAEADRAKVREWADAAHTRACDAGRITESLRCRATTIWQRFAGIESMPAGADRRQSVEALWDDLESLSNDLNALPIGVWLP